MHKQVKWSHLGGFPSNAAKCLPEKDAVRQNFWEDQVVRSSRERRRVVVERVRRRYRRARCGHTV